MTDASEELDTWAHGGANFDVNKVIKIIDEQNAKIVQASGRATSIQELSLQAKSTEVKWALIPTNDFIQV